MIIYKKRKSKKNQAKYKYKKKSVYDDYETSKIDYRKVDKNSLAYKDALAAEKFLNKAREIKKKSIAGQKAAKRERTVKPVVQSKMSLGERRVFNYLERKKITFEPEKEFKGMTNYNGVGSLRIDFYLPEHKIAIEYDGRQHFESCARFDTSTNTLQHRQSNDRFKDKFCSSKGIKMVRINYKQYNMIEHILDTVIIKPLTL